MLVLRRAAGGDFLRGKFNIKYPNHQNYQDTQSPNARYDVACGNVVFCGSELDGSYS